MTPSLFMATSRPQTGEPCSLEQLAEHICDDAMTCEHAIRCARQPVGPDATCFAIQNPQLLLRAQR